MARRRLPRGSSAGGPRPRLAEPGMFEGLVKLAATGVPLELAAQTQGVTPRSLTRWLARGRIEYERIEDLLDTLDDENAPRPDPLPEEAPYLDFYLAMMKARAEAAARNMANLQKVSQGGFITERTTRTLPDGTVETTEKKAPPDWRAAAWYLEKSHRETFGKEPSQVEVTGAGGQPLQVETKHAETLAAQISANIAAITAAPHDPDAEVIDAEVED